ncbi:MAG: hypothetical protein AB2990_02400 [Candidatus Symbiodolus clandestinus]
MISNQKSNSVKSKQRRILKTNHYLKRLLKKLRKRLVRRWQEMPFIRPNQPEGNSNLKKKLHTSPKKIKPRRVSTTEEDKISRVKSFKVRSQCSDLNINQDFITLKKTPPLKNFSALIKPMRIFTLSRLICRLPILTKIFYYSEKSIQKSRTRPIVTINTGLSACIPEYKYEHTDFHNKRRSISRFNPDRIIHPYFDFVKKYPLFKKNSFNKSIKPEDSERNLHSFHKSSDNNLSKTCLDNIMQTINNSTAEIFKIKEAAKKFKKDLENSENNQQKTEYLIHQLQDLEKEVIKIESLRIQAMTDIINTDRNSKDSEGKTLAHHLAEYGDHSLLKYLITFQYLDPFIKDNQGFLPKDIANNNRLGITQGHMKATQEFLSRLTPENFKIDPENPPSPLTLDIDTRDYFMPKSHSSKPASSKEGSFPNLSKNGDLIKLIKENKNDTLTIDHLYKKYILDNPPINFKDICNSAIECDQPFYLSLILYHFHIWLPRNNAKDFKETPIIKAIHSEKIYPFAMLLHFKNLNELHINHKMDNENVFDTANRLKKSFHVFLLAMKNEDLIKRIDDEEHKNRSHLKEKIIRIIEKSLLKDPYDSIISDFFELRKNLDKLFLIDDNEPYSQVIKLKSSIETITNEIEKKLQKLKDNFIKICNSPEGGPQANPTPQNLPHTLASYQAPQSSHPVSHSTNRCDFPVTPTILTTELNRGTDS